MPTLLTHTFDKGTALHPLAVCHGDLDRYRLENLGEAFLDYVAGKALDTEAAAFDKMAMLVVVNDFAAYVAQHGVRKLSDPAPYLTHPRLDDLVELTMDLVADETVKNLAHEQLSAMSLHDLEQTLVAYDEDALEAA